MSHQGKKNRSWLLDQKNPGQVDSIETLAFRRDDCADILMLLANVRGGINSLMAEVLKTISATI